MIPRIHFLTTIGERFSAYTRNLGPISKPKRSSVPVFRLRGVVQHYAWGGTDYLPSLLNTPNEEQQPWAEYWLGVHPKGPTQVHLEGYEKPLADFLATLPGLLSQTRSPHFRELPFLFKVLDVRQMLSIQLHPTKEKAEIGFAKEEQLGIPALAPNRNYKDQNHKPEMMVALTDFWLLHGFRSASAIRASLINTPGWQDLLPTLEEFGVKGLYQKVMEADQQMVTGWMTPLYEDLRARKASLQEQNPDYWAWEAFQQYSVDGQHDRGIFSIYWFNLIQLSPGEGIFQGAGIPHAYLRGVNVELMANSDNVLRGGLTPKHIDVPELLDNIVTDTVVPQIQQGILVDQGVVDYPVPVPDFKLKKVELKTGASVKVACENATIGLIISGILKVEDTIFQAGESFLSGAGDSLELVNQASTDLSLFLASF